MRGIYRAVDLYNSDPEKFLEVAAPTYDVTPDQMKADLGGVYYTSYEDALEFFGVGQDPKLKDVIDGLNAINVDLDLMDQALDYDTKVPGRRRFASSRRWRPYLALPPTRNQAYTP
jgi:NitT/TauT family transport system substrate-binding protein